MIVAVRKDCFEVGIMRSLLIAIPALLTVALVALKLLVLVILEH